MNIALVFEDSRSMEMNLETLCPFQTSGFSSTKAEENLETNVLCSTIFFENHAVCEIMWKNVVEPGRSQVTIWGMRI